MRLDTERYEYSIILGSDGLWSVMNPAYCKPYGKYMFTNKKFGVELAPSMLPQQLCDMMKEEALSRWNYVSYTF